MNQLTAILFSWLDIIDEEVIKERCPEWWTNYTRLQSKLVSLIYDGIINDNQFLIIKFEGSGPLQRPWVWVKRDQIFC